MTGYINTEERSARLNALRKRIMKAKAARGLTYRQIGSETGLSYQEVQNATNWVARYDVCVKLEAWCDKQEIPL